MGTLQRGFDVSHYQGSVDWAALKARYGITWGATKATEGDTYRDSQFGANWRKLKAAGLVRMAYHFAHPGGKPDTEAKAFLSYVNANGLEAEDILCMDMESNPNNLPMLAVRDWLAGWADIVTKETGRKPFLYCGGGYIANNATKDIKSHFAAWWFPRYPSAYDGNRNWPTSISGYTSPNNWGGAPDIWQFTQSFGGGNMDASIANMSLDDLKTRGRASTSKPPATPPVEEDNMANWTEDQLRTIVRTENEKYGSRLWAAPTGTGTHLVAAVAALSKAVAAIGNQIAATDKVNDQAFNDAMSDLGTKLDALQNSLKSEDPAQ